MYIMHHVYVCSQYIKNIYSKFIGCLRNINILIDRKILSTLAFTDLSSFNLIERESRKSSLFKH